MQSSCPGELSPSPQSEWFGLWRMAVKRQGESPEQQIFSQPEFFRKVLDQTMDCYLYLSDKYHELLFRINHLFYARFLSLISSNTCMSLFNHLLPKLRLTKDRLTQGDSRHSDTQVTGALHLLGLLLEKVPFENVNILFKSDLILDVLTGSLLDRPNLTLRHQLLQFLSQCCSLSKKLTIRLLKKKILPDLPSLKTLNLLNVLLSSQDFIQKASVYSPKYLRRTVSQLISLTDKVITVNSPPSASECSVLYHLLLVNSCLFKIAVVLPDQFFSSNLFAIVKRFSAFLDACLRQSLDSLSNTQRAFVLGDFLKLLLIFKAQSKTSSFNICSNAKLTEIFQEVVKGKFPQHHNIREGNLYKIILNLFKQDSDLLETLNPRLVSALLSKVYAFLLRNPSWFSYYPTQEFFVQKSVESTRFSHPKNLENYCLAPILRPNELSFMLVDFQELLKNNLTDFPSHSFFFNKESKSVPRTAPISDLCNNSYSFCHLLTLNKFETRNEIVKLCLEFMNKLLWEKDIKAEIIEKFIDSLLVSTNSAIVNNKGNNKVTKEKCLFIILITFAKRLIFTQKDSNGKFKKIITFSPTTYSCKNFKTSSCLL